MSEKEKLEECEFGVLELGQVSNLQGKVLTIIDASIEDSEKRNHLKSAVGSCIWDWGMTQKMFATNDQLERLGKKAEKMNIPFTPQMLRD